MKSQQLETLSALMDDELSAREAQAYVDQLLDDAEAQAAWLSFHVVKDGMQKTDCDGSAQLFASICARLDDEPTVVAAQPAIAVPQKPAANQWYRGFSVAASVLVAAVAIWQMWPATQTQLGNDAGMLVTNSAPAPQEAIMNVSQPMAAPRVDHSLPMSVVPVNNRNQDYLNDPYLRAHQEVLNQDEWVSVSFQQEGQR